MDENKDTRMTRQIPPFQSISCYNIAAYLTLTPWLRDPYKLEYRRDAHTTTDLAANWNVNGWGFRAVEDVFWKRRAFWHPRTNFHPRLDMDDVDSENSVCMTWSIDPSGTMRHRKTGTKVSTKEGITCPGSRQHGWFPVFMSRYDFLMFLCPCPEYRFGPCDETVPVLLDISHGDDVLDAVLTETWSPRWMSPDVQGDNGGLVAEDMKILLSNVSPRKIVKRKMIVSWSVEFVWPSVAHSHPMSFLFSTVCYALSYSHGWFSKRVHTYWNNL